MTTEFQNIKTQEKAFSRQSKIQFLNQHVSIAELAFKVLSNYTKSILLTIFAFFAFAYFIGGWVPQHITDLLKTIKDIITTELMNAKWQNLLIISLLILALRGYSIFIKTKFINLEAKKRSE